MKKGSVPNDKKLHCETDNSHALVLIPATSSKAINKVTSCTTFILMRWKKCATEMNTHMA